MLPTSLKVFGVLALAALSSASPAPGLTKRGGCYNIADKCDPGHIDNSNGVNDPKLIIRCAVRAVGIETQLRLNDYIANDHGHLVWAKGCVSHSPQRLLFFFLSCSSFLSLFFTTASLSLFCVCR